MSKVDEALAQIATIEDTTNRAFQLAGLTATLFKIKGIAPVILGSLAYDCYVGDSNTNRELWMGIFAGKASPHIMREIFSQQLHGNGVLWEWQIAGTNVHITGDAPLELKDLTREFQSDYGGVRLVAIEELTAELVLASIFPEENPQAAQEAKRLMGLGLSNALVFNWRALQDLCNTNNYRVGEQLATLRMEAKNEYDEEEKRKTGALPLPRELAPAAVDEPSVFVEGESVENSATSE